MAEEKTALGHLAADGGQVPSAASKGTPCPKHTPGPWFYQEGADAYTHIVRPVGNPNWIITHCAQGTAPVYEANARLIAATPDLLAELENIANADPSKWDVEVRDQFQQWAQNRARAAIAKATGEQS